MPPLRKDQLAAVAEVTSFASSSSQISLAATGEWRGCATLRIDLDTRGFTRGNDGLDVQPIERVVILISPDYPISPPLAAVEHLRWAGFPHVLQGTWLCIYLDPGSEWDPTRGMAGFIARLWEWFGDAIGDRFDPATALYHPVGGVLHRTDGAPTVVAAHSMPGDLFDGDVVHRIGLRPRTDHRIDIAAWKPPYEIGLVPGLLVVLPEYLPLGGGHHLSDLLAIVRQQLDRDQRRALETSLRRLIRDLGDDDYLHAIIAVPNPADGREVSRHLIGWRLPVEDGAKALAAARNAASSASDSKEPAVEWTYVDDQRPEVTVRRDSGRPVTVYAGSKIAVWGCGALGSWIAELLVRAGARRVMLRDPGFVSRGLLVRQNYTEADVGRPKAEALAERLSRLSDTCEVIGIAGHAQAGLQADAESYDFIFDTTVNTAMNAALDEAQRQGILGVPVVQAATDNQTATLGIVTVTDGTPAATPSELDQALRNRSTSDPNLAPYRTFWDHNAHPPLTPTQGCSVPTFHGSGADAMGIAASAISAAAIALYRQLAGGYFMALPHSPFKTPALTSVESAIQTNVKVA